MEGFLFFFQSLGLFYVSPDSHHRKKGLFVLFLPLIQLTFYFCLFDWLKISLKLWSCTVLALQTRMASNSQRSACLCLPDAGIKGVHHQCPTTFFFFVIFFSGMAEKLVVRQDTVILFLQICFGYDLSSLIVFTAQLYFVHLCINLQYTHQLYVE